MILSFMHKLKKSGPLKKGRAFFVWHPGMDDVGHWEQIVTI